MKPNNINSGITSNSGYGGPITSQLPAPQGAQPQTAPATTGGDEGNWLTQLLPSGGGIAGGLGGAALGASIGSVVPIIGTGIGGLLGGILGASAGGGIGKVAENSAEGKSLDNGVANEALSSGAGELIGGGVGKVLGTGAKLLSKRAGTLTAEAGEKAAQTDAVAAANAIKNNYGGVKPGVQSANNLEGHLTTLKGWGVDHTNPEAMAAASKGGLYLNDIDEAALAAGSPIKTSHLISSKDITQASEEEQQALIKAGIITPEGSIPNTVTPTQANKFAQDLNGQMRDIQGVADNASRNGDFGNYQAAKAQLKNLTDKYKNVQTLASTPEVDATIAARTVTPEEKTSLVEQFGQKQADHLEDAINSSKTHGDLVKAKLPFAQMNTISKQALGDFKASGTARAVARAKGDVTGDGIADPVAAQAGIVSDVANAKGITGKGLVVGKHVLSNPKIADTMSRIAGLSSKLAPSAGAGIGAANGQLTDPSLANAPGATIGGTMQATPDPNQPIAAGAPQSPTGGLSREDLLTLALYSPSAFGNLTAPSADNQAKVSAASTAEQALSGLGEAPSGGIISQLGGALGIGSAGAYQRQAQSAAQQVAAALPGSDAKTIEAQLTNYLAGGANIQDAVKALMSNLQAVQQNNTNNTYQQLQNFNPSVISAAGL